MKITKTKNGVIVDVRKEATKEWKKIEKANKRLEEIRKSIENDNISYGEIAELQSLVEYIDKGDVLLLEWAGVPELKEVREINDIDLQEISRLVRGGNTGGILDDEDGTRIVWKLTIEMFNN